MTPLRLGDRVRLLPSVLKPVIDPFAGAIRHIPDPTIWTVLRQDGDLVMIFERRGLGDWFELVQRDQLEVTYCYPHKDRDSNAAPQAR